MISIGSVYRGPELEGSAINETLRRAVKALRELRGQLVLGKTPLVNVVFVVPGSLGETDFSGLRFGDFSKKDKAVVVQVAVPPAEISNTNVGPFIIKSLHAANEMAAKFFQEKGETFALNDAEKMVSEIAKRMNVTERTAPPAASTSPAR